MAVLLNAKIPFQPGLFLGSVVKGDTIEQMNNYNKNVAKIERLQKEMHGLQQIVEEFDTKIKGLVEVIKTQNPEKSVFNEQLMKIFLLQKASVEEQIEKLPSKLAKIAEKQVGYPSFSNFSTGLESPIDFDTAYVDTDNRGFDSLTYSCQYIDMYKDSQAIDDTMNQHSSTSGIGVGGSFAAHSWSSAAMKRAAEIKKQGDASKVLVINALVTSRHVRHFKNRTYSLEKLQTILNTMRTGTDKELKKKGITVITDKSSNKTTKAIYLLTEAVMGGSFSAILTYLNEDESHRNLAGNAKHKSKATGVDISKGYSVFQDKVDVNTASQTAHEKHRDEIQNHGNLNMQIEFIVQGTVPKLAKDTVIREVLKHQDQHLRDYISSGKEQKGQSVRDRQAILQNAMYDALNSIQKTSTQQEKITIHSPQSVLQAYDDFSEEITSDPLSGVPIGFNYTILEEETIERLVKESTSQPANLDGDQKKS